MKTMIRHGRRRRDPAGAVAVVTGAGSGIGRALALGLAERGAVPVICDNDPEGLAETDHHLRERGIRAVAETVDVRDEAAVRAFADHVLARYGRVEQLYNNAGVAFDGYVLESDLADIRRVMDVNFRGVVNGTVVFLPHLIDSGRGVLVNISSLFGLLSLPGQAAYNASKFAVRGFTESLRQEMLVERRPVSVTCVHPGGVRTNIVDSAIAGPYAQRLRDHYNEVFLRMPPEVAARKILDGASAGRARILLGAEAHLLDALVRVAPSGYQRLLAVIARDHLPRSGVPPRS